MSFAQGCLLSRAAILTSLLVASEQEVLEQRLSSGPINKGGYRHSAAGRSAAGLYLDRERPWWASHKHFGVNWRDKSSPACVGSMILRRQALQACRGMHVPAIQILDPSFAKYRLALTSVERLGTGVHWAEGPVWFGDRRMLLFSDVPSNRIM